MPGQRSRPVSVRVSGEWACFTRPEMKVERVTYQYPTPSAARGVLEAICWHPQFRWVVTRIDVLKPPRYQGLTRNEVQKKVPEEVPDWMTDPDKFEPFYANIRGREEKENATQRSTLALRDVAYNIHAYLIVDGTGLRPEDTPEKYVQMFERRVAAGQCFHRPYLGCREFAADFAPVDPSERPIGQSAELGLMLYDIIFATPGKKARNEAVFFPARIENGVIITDPDVVLRDDRERQRVLTC